MRQLGTLLQEGLADYSQIAHSYEAQLCLAEAYGSAPLIGTCIDRGDVSLGKEEPGSTISREQGPQFPEHPNLLVSP